MNLQRGVLAGAVALVLMSGSDRALRADGPEKKLQAFGTLEAVDTDKARSDAQAWLKASGKTDAATLAKFEGIWKDRGDLIERVARTLELGSPKAAKLLAEARNVQAPAPTKVPTVLTDETTPRFLRGNLALAYARELIHRRVYEEALAALNAVKAEDVVDPASYLFHRAVCEHGLLQKDHATQSINRLVDDVVTAPERYKTVAVLMLLDMQAWREKDLGEIARKMDNVERRLQLARGGPATQKIQKEILRRLDEMIKELEAKKKPGA